MKKDIAKKLNGLAEKMPIILEEKVEFITLDGFEMNLSGYGEGRKWDRNKHYEVPVPMFKAVDHKQQLKEAYKRGGIEAVWTYFNKVIEDAKTSTYKPISLN